jgi:hypothetical protein
MSIPRSGPSKIAPPSTSPTAKGSTHALISRRRRATKARFPELETQFLELRDAGFKSSDIRPQNVQQTPCTRQPHRNPHNPHRPPSRSPERPTHQDWCRSSSEDVQQKSTSIWFLIMASGRPWRGEHESCARKTPPIGVEWWVRGWQNSSHFSRPERVSMSQSGC